MAKLRGIDKRDEINPRTQRRNMRSLGEKFVDFLRDPQAGMSVLIACAGATVFLPAATDFILVMSLFFTWLIVKADRSFALHFKIPKRARRLDGNEIKPGTEDEAGMASGVFYLGNDRDTNAELWVSKRDAGTHGLVFGTTGSGKTEMLLGICENALTQGSGLMFVDGKAQNKVAFRIMDLCRAKLRDDDVHVINFMTGARDVSGPQRKKLSHTINPLSHGSSSMISQLIVGLMSSGGGGGDDIWKDRAIAFVEALSPPLVYLRDNYGYLLDVNEYRKYFELDKLEELVWKGKDIYPGIEKSLDALSSYVVNLPGYDRKKYGTRTGQEPTTKEQHGYITMQLVRAFTSLADTYGHIVRTPLGETDFRDLVLNRRILIVMLPSLEKTPSETANLGKLIVSSLRAVMVEGLGSEMEGFRREMEEGGAAGLPSPFVIILDEYGYYAVKGFAVAFAQGRSLGMSIWVGGQDMASFKKESKEEAESVCGNTVIQCFGKIQDPGETMEFAIKSGGKAMISKASGYEGETGMAGTAYTDTMNAGVEVIDRIDTSDIKEQREGQFHVVVGSTVVRAKMFFVDPPPVARIRLNHFIRVSPPDVQDMKELEMLADGTSANSLLNIDLDGLLGDDVRLQSDTERALTTMRENAKLFSVERGIAGIVGAARAATRRTQAFRTVLKDSDGDGSAKSGNELLDTIMATKRAVQGVVGPGVKVADPAKAREAEVVAEADDLLGALSSIAAQSGRTIQSAGGASSEDFESVGVGGRSSGQAADGGQSTKVVAREAGVYGQTEDVDLVDFEAVSVFMPGTEKARESVQGFGRDVLSEGGDSERALSIEAALAAPEPDESPEPALNFRQTLESITEIEKHLGAPTDEAAEASALGLVKDMQRVTTYPVREHIPPVKQQEEVMDMMGQIISDLDGFLNGTSE